MSNLTQEEEERYSDMAMKHAHFLCDQVFKPAFEMAFIHGAKHMKEDMMKGSYICDTGITIPEQLASVQETVRPKH